MTDLRDWQFPGGVHRFSTALHMHEIDPGRVRIELPFDDWWKLWCAIERYMPGLYAVDTNHRSASEFRYMGFTFVGRKETE